MSDWITRVAGYVARRSVYVPPLSMFVVRMAPESRAAATFSTIAIILPPCDGLNLIRE